MRTARRAEIVRATQERADELFDSISAAVDSGQLDEAVAILSGYFVPLVESEDAARADGLLSELLPRAAEIKAFSF